jgi:hypothetical protein
VLDLYKKGIQLLPIEKFIKGGYRKMHAKSEGIFNVRHVVGYEKILFYYSVVI